MQTAENLRAGLSPSEARRQALLKFGNVEAIKEIYRDQRGLPFMETLMGDTRHALRRMRKAPTFTAAVIVTLALGIGANTAIFGVIDSILIRPLAYPQAEALVSVSHTVAGLPGLATAPCSPSMYFTYREENRIFEQFGVWSSRGASVTELAEPEMPRALFVTYGVLDAVGVRPLLGRWFSQTDDTPGSPETVMLTYGYWQRRFGGDTSIVGRTLTIDSRPRTVIGVMPEAFRFQRDPELILPQRFERNTQFLVNFSYQGIARLKPGVTIEQANADVARLLGVWLNAWPPNPGMDRAVVQNARFGPRLQPLKQDVVGDISTALWVVMGTLGLLLLIACANVANLLLVRAESRQQELAIRAALGAGRGRIAREMLVESITLGVLGGALGLGLAYAALRILVVRGPDTLPRLDEIGIDPLVLAFAFGVSVLSGVLFGVMPIVKYAGPRIATALRGIGRTFSHDRERHRARHVLVVVQVALALVLLIGSGLMIRTFQHLRSVQPGFTHPEEIQILHAMIPMAIAKEPERVMRMQHEILDKLAAIPGVTSVGFGSRAPLESFLGGNLNPIHAEDKTFAEGRMPTHPANPQDRTGILQDDGNASRCRTRLQLDRPVRQPSRRHRVGKSRARVVGRSRCCAGQADSRSRRGRSLARNRRRRRKRVRRRCAREAARVRLLAGPDGPLHLGRRERIRCCVRHVRDPLQPDRNGGLAGRGAASHLVRERQAAGVPRHHTRRRSTTSPWHGRRLRS